MKELLLLNNMSTKIKKKKFLYNYLETGFSEGVKLAIILYAIAVLFLIISIFISFILGGEAPSIIAGVGISSILFNIASIINIILEVYLYDNYKKEIRTMLLLQLVLFAIWILVI